MQRVKEEHEQELDGIQGAKEAEINDIKLQCETQVQELTEEYNERMEELKG